MLHKHIAYLLTVLLLLFSFFVQAQTPLPAQDIQFDTSAGNNAPFGTWSDGTTIWVADGSFVDSDDRRRVFAYNLSSRARDTSKEFELNRHNASPQGIWSDGTTMWVVDAHHGSPGPHVFAYNISNITDMSDMTNGVTRDTSREFDLVDVNSAPQGMWSNANVNETDDSDTMWVVDHVSASNKPRTVFAYSLAGGGSDTIRAFQLHADNRDPRGIWSDGNTLWVADSTDDHIYAYTYRYTVRGRIRTTPIRDTSREFSLPAANGFPYGLESDGTTMWVTDHVDRRIYAYTLPTGIPPVLTETRAVSTPTMDTTPQYRFNSTEVGSLSYGGACHAFDTDARKGDNRIDFFTPNTRSPLAEGTYTDCTITVTDLNGDVSLPLAVTPFTISIPPVLTAVSLAGIPIAEIPEESILINSNTPEYVFHSTEAGTISYAGGCTSSTTDAAVDNNTITFNTLGDGEYTGCTVTVTDATGNDSNILTVPDFTIDATAPGISQVTAIATPSNDTTPDYVFNSDEAGAITYGGACSSTTTRANVGDNAISFNSLADGTYNDCTIIVTDALGNASNTLAVTAFTIDTTAPSIVEVTAIITPSNNTTPDYVFNSDEVGAITVGGACSSTTTSASVGDNPISFNSLVDGEYSDCTIIVTDAVGNASNTLAVTAFTIDTVAPTVMIDNVPAATSDVFTVAINFNEAVTGFAQADITVASGMVSGLFGSGSSYTATITPASGLLNNMAITIDIAAGVAMDLAGNANVAAAQRSVMFATTDTINPQIQSIRRMTPPVPVTNSDTLVWLVVFSESVKNVVDDDFSLTATMDGMAIDVSSVILAVAGNDGATSYQVMASGGNLSTLNAIVSLSIITGHIIADNANNLLTNLNPIGVVESYTLDNTAPIISEVVAIATPSNDTTPEYIFSSNAAGAISYGGSCSSTTTSASAHDNTISFNSLADGEYSDCTIIVTDVAGNASNTLTVTAFTIEATAPSISEVTAIVTPTNDATPEYVFNSDEAGTITYGGACSSAMTSASVGDNAISFNSLVDGEYSDCTIIVTDPVGNASNTLAVPAFSIDATAPSISEVTAIATPTNDTTPEYVFNSNEAGAITYGGACSSRRTSASVGDNAISFESLVDGEYTDCTIIVTDPVSNASNTLAVPAFIIDTTAPSISEVTAIATPSNDATPEYVFNSDEAGTITVGGSCSSTTTSANASDNAISFNSLADSEYSDCTIIVTDPAGNASNTLAVPAFTIDTIAPSITEVTAVETPGDDTTPEYTFNSDEAGAITVGGACSSTTTRANVDDNFISFNSLADGTYVNCTIIVTDAAGNASNTLAVPAFTIESTAPIISEVTAIVTPSNDTTPDYVFDSDEAGAITYGGSCSSATTSASVGDNAISFNSLADGTYSDCTIIVTDSTGNASNTLAVTAFTIDATAPSISQVTAIATPSNDTTPDYVFNSDQAGDITVGGACSSRTTSANVGDNPISFNRLADGEYSDCTIIVTDPVGNVSNTLAVPTFTIDTTAPSISEVTAIATPSNDTTPDYVFNSDEVGAITVGGSCSSTTSNASVGDNPISFNSLANGTYIDCTIIVTDGAGNASNTLAVTAFTIDTIAPTVMIDNVPATTSGTFTVAINFNEVVTGFAVEDIVLVNGMVSNIVSANNESYSVTIIPNAALSDGAMITINIAAVAAMDLAGNGNVAAAQRSVMFATTDNINPELSSIRRMTPAAPVNNSGTLTWLIVFSENVNNVDAGDFSVSNTSATLAVTDGANATSYEVTASGGDLATLNATVRLSIGTGHGITDLAGNPLTALMPTGDDESYMVDNIAPSISEITAIVTPTNDATPEYIFNSNEAGAISYDGACGSTTTSASASDNTISFNSLIDGEYNDCTIRVTDAAGNASNTLAVTAFIIDTTAPDISEVTAIADPTNDATPEYVFNSDEAGDITVGGACSSATTSAAAGDNAISFNSLVDGEYTDCTIIVTDAVGNASNTLAVPDFTIETVAPTVTIDNAPDITNGTFMVTINFSEAVMSFAPASITVGNGRASDVVGSGSSYTATIIPANGLLDMNIITINIAAGAITDLAGNGNVAADQVTVNFMPPDITAPMIREVADIVTPTNDATPEYIFSSDEAGDITVGGACSSTTTIANIGENAISFNNLVDDEYSNCSIIVTDDAGNVSNILSVGVFTIDTMLPEVENIRRMEPPVPATNSGTLTWLVTFSEGVTNVGANDFALSNTSADLAVVTGGDASSYEVTASEGDLADLNATVSLSIATDHDIDDLAGNDLTDLMPTDVDESYTVDNIAPQVRSITRMMPSDPSDEFTNAETLTWLVVFSEGVSNVSTSDFAVSNTSATLAVTTGANAASYGVTAIGGDLAGVNGIVSLSIDADHDIADFASNDLTDLMPTDVDESYTVDNTAPSISQVTAIATPSNDTTPEYIFNSDEAGDITVGGACSSATTNASASDNAISFNSLVDGEYSDCTIIVTDAAGNASNTLSVNTFTIDTTAPTVEAGDMQLVSISSTVTLTGTASDRAGAALTYAWSQNSGDTVALNTATMASTTFTAPAMVGDLEFLLTVTDDLGNMASDSVTINVRTLAVDAGIDQLVAGGAVVMLTATVLGIIDPTYEWRQISGDIVALETPAMASTSFTAPNSDDALIFQVTTTSGTETFMDTVTVNVDATAPSLAEITAVPTPTTDTTPEYTFSSDEAGTISYAGGCVSSTTDAIDVNNTITFNALADGEYACTITVTDGLGNASEPLTVTAFTIDTTAPSISEATAIVTPSNDATPEYIFNSNEVGDITVGGSCSSAMTRATASDNAISFNSLVDGTYTDCTIIVTDPVGNTSNTLTVTAFTIDTAAPVVEAGNMQLVSTSSTVTLTGTASDRAGATLSYAWSQSSGDTVALNTATMASTTFTAPATAGDLVFMLTVMDDAGNMASDNVTINVSTITINAGIDQAVVGGAMVTLTATVIPEGITGLSYAWSQLSGTLVTLSTTSMASTSFTAAPDSDATLIFQVTATSGTEAFMDTVTVNVDANAPRLVELREVPTPTSDTTPEYSFNSNESGTISYTGGCASSTTDAIDGDNTISFDALTEGDYTDCTITVTDAVGNASAPLSVTDFTIDTNAPTVEAGDTQLVSTSSIVTLVGTASDRAGATLSYAWSQVSGDIVTLDTATMASTTFTAPAAVGDLTFMLTVTDDAGNMASDSVTINVRILAIDAGENQIVAGSAIVMLTATVVGITSPTYAWSQLSGDTVTLNTTSMASTSFTAPNSDDALTFQVTTTSSTETLMDTVTVTVDATAPGLAETTAVATPTADTTPEYIFSSDEAGEISYGGGCSSSVTDAIDGNNTISFNSLVDGDYAGCTITVSDTVGNASEPLVVTAFTIDTTAPNISETTAVATLSNDATPDYVFNSDEAGNISYAGGCSSSTTDAIDGDNTITFNTLADGEYAGCTITVTDGLGNASQPLAVTAFTIDTTAPTVEAGNMRLVSTSSTVTLAGTASDRAGATLTYAWSQNSGDTVTLDTPAMASTSFNAPATAGDLVFELTVTDDLGNSATDSVTISVRTLAVDAGIDQLVAGGDMVTLTATVVGITSPTYAWSQLNGDTVVLSTTSMASTTFTAPNSNGLLEFQVTATSGTDTFMDTVTVTIDATASSLAEITAVPALTTDTTPEYTFSSDGAGDISYAGGCSSSVTDAIDGNNTISFNALADGEYVACTITVTDGLGNASQPLTVTAFTIDTTAPTVEPGNMQLVSTSSTVTLAGTASDRAGATLIYAWSQNSGDTVTLDTPAMASTSFTAPATVGDLEFVFTVTDDLGNEASDSVTISVRTLAVDAGIDQLVAGGEMVTLTATVVGITSPTYEWIQISGTLATLSTATMASTSFTAPNSNGTLIFQVTTTSGTETFMDTVTVNIDATAPSLAEITAVPTPTTDTTPEYTFSSDEAGDISYAGGCSSSTTNAIDSNNTITFNSLADGDYACTITVTDVLGNASQPLAVNAFTIDTTAPDIRETTAVATLSNDATPEYIFNSDEVGDITIGGSCSSTTTSASLGDNAISFNSLVDGEYSDCTIIVTDAVGNASNTLTVPTFTIDTTAPTVEAGNMQLVLTSSIVTLAGTASDRAGATLIYAWSQSNGDTVALNTPAMASTTFTAPATVGDLEFVLTVTDDAGNMASDNITISVRILAVDAGIDQLVAGGAMVDLTATAVGITAPTYAWSQLSGTLVTLSTTSMASTSFTAAPDSGATLIFQVTATSGTETFIDTVTITVDVTAPRLLEITAVPTPTADTTPEYIFNSDEAGTISYAGGCVSSTTDAIDGNNTITFNTLAEGDYAGCEITVSDAVANASRPLVVTAFTIDTTMPAVETITTTVVAGTYGIGTEIAIQVEFTEAVVVTGSPVLLLNNNGGQAVYSTGSNSDTLTFNYTVLAGQGIDSLNISDTNPLILAAGITIEDPSGNTATLADDFTTDGLSDISISAPGVILVSGTEDGNHQTDDIVTIQVQFSEAVSITGGGDLQLELETGDIDRMAMFSELTNTAISNDTLVFTYTVQEGDRSRDLAYTNTGALVAVGGTSITSATGEVASLSLPALDAPSSLAGSSDIVIGIVIEEQNARLNAMLLPKMAQAMSAVTIDAITRRIEEASDSSDQTASASSSVSSAISSGISAILPSGLPSLKDLDLSELLSDLSWLKSFAYDFLIAKAEQSARSGSIDLDSILGSGFDIKRVLGNSEFVIPLNASEGDSTGSGATSSMVLWGSGNYSNLSDNDDGLDYDGDIYSINLGIDSQISRETLLGISVNWSNSDFDYRDATTVQAGDYGYKLYGINPYISWSPQGLGGGNLWATLGYGIGEIENQIEGVEKVETDTRQYQFSGGGRYILSSSADRLSQLSIKGDLTLLRIDIDQSAGFLGSDIDSQSFRLLLQGSSVFNHGGYSFTPSLEGGLRYDLGDGDTGGGIELSPAFTYKSLDDHILIEGRGRYLVAGQYDQWGLSVLARIDQARHGRGLSFSMHPTWGQSQGQAEQLTAHNGSRFNDYRVAKAEAQIKTELSYGMRSSHILGQTMLFTPYAEFTLGEDARYYQFGQRLSIGELLSLSFKLSHHQRRGYADDNYLGLESAINF